MTETLEESHSNRVVLLSVEHSTRREKTYHRKVISRAFMNWRTCSGCQVALPVIALGGPFKARRSKITFSFSVYLFAHAGASNCQR